MTTYIDNDLEDNILRPFKRAAVGVAVFIAVTLIWATTAKLATTVHVSGTLVSSQPRYELQHAYGGKVQNVLVEQHDNITKGQAIFELDVALQRSSLSEIETQVNFLVNDNTTLDILLAGTINHSAMKNLPKSALNKYYSTKFALLKLNLDNTAKAVQSLDTQASLRQISLNLLQERHNISQDRLSNIEGLALKGIATKAQKEDYSERLLNLSSEINDTIADLTALRDQMRQTGLKSTQYKTEFRLELQKKRVANHLRLPELRRQVLGLRDEIANAIIRSPISGSVLEVNYTTNQMLIPKGATLAVISRPLIDPMVQVTIPTSSIDQVNTGMKGSLTLSSLPQRNLSKVSAELVAISPDVFLDSSGLPIGYKAIAKINHDELVMALSNLNINLHLSSGMPASLALEGRKITFSQYLVAPFFKVFQGALQD